ncbi:hypothetical protein NQ318_006879 [Aromia moschata]|uniref:Alkaline phosphatase n=1 Tax=Aromia moschata TaxID=1265417 RepID=A0AAV8YID0_9CUCU|nr:hypothetical protein NQ318_006879 [Aromia moschata]
MMPQLRDRVLVSYFRLSYKVAKNIIVFIGDGMGVSTITSARIYKGQRLGAAGEEYQLTFEKFSNVALVKTYAVDMQVPDSAATATAIFTGVKTRYESVGVDVNCNNSIFDEIVYEGCKVDSMMVWAQEANKHTDAKGKAKDIARQLVENAPGKNYKVILGGGQQQMGHTTNYTEFCTREDGRNLTSIWASNHTGTNYVLASNNEQLNTVTDDTEYLMGIFAPDHMPYELVRDTGPTGTPSLSDMTRKALQVLKKGPNGFVLVVSLPAHHQNYARLAMEETSEFDNAIALAINETGPDTLILVTADHSHSFTMEGYSKRGNDILGYTEKAGEDDRPFLTLGIC